MSAKRRSDFSSSSFHLCFSFSHCSSCSFRFELSLSPSAIGKPPLLFGVKGRFRWRRPHSSWKGGRRLCAVLPAPLSAREQRADVGQEFVGADGAVAVLFDETVNALVDAAR